MITTHVASGATASLWGIESNCTGYQQQVARELVNECIASDAFKVWQRKPVLIDKLRNHADAIDASRAKGLQLGMIACTDDMPAVLREAVNLLEGTQS